MPRTPRLIAFLAVANGLLTLLTGLTIVRCAVRPGGPPEFASIAGLLLVFAVLAFVVFVGGGILQLDPRAGRTGLVLLAGLAVIDGLANGVFIVAAAVGFGTSATLHWWTATTSCFLAVLATVELAARETPWRDEITRATDPWQPRRLTPWPVSLILSAATVGGIATFAGVGASDFAMDGIREPRTETAIIAVTCLVLMALGAGAVAATAALQRRKSLPSLGPLPAILAILVVTSGALAISTAVMDVRDFHLTGFTPSTHVSWSGRFWLALSIALVIAILLGAALASEDPARDLPRGRLPS